MFEMVGTAAINYFSWVFMGIVVGLVVNYLNQNQDDLIPSLISSIMGALGGGLISQLIFGSQLTLVNISSLFLVLSSAFLLSILVQLLRTNSEKEVLKTSGDLVFYSQITRPKDNLKSLLDEVEYPISSRDLIRLAEKESVSRAELGVLEALPDHIYKSKQEILNKLSH